MSQLAQTKQKHAHSPLAFLKRQNALESSLRTVEANPLFLNRCVQTLLHHCHLLASRKHKFVLKNKKKN